jgi:hypothetical protein
MQKHNKSLLNFSKSDLARLKYIILKKCKVSITVFGKMDKISLI